MSTPDASDETLAAVAAAHRAHWGTVLAATVALTRDLDLAEDSVQEAFAQALETWPRTGVPDGPGGWLATAARRRALDAVRRRASLQRKLPLLVWDESGRRDPPDPRVEDEAVPEVLDERLRLIFLAAHPALSPTSRVALTLRLVAGVPTATIAAAFLVGEATMAARLTRAKKRIVLSRIPCRVPGGAELEERLVDVLDVLSVLLATGDGSEGTAGEQAAVGRAAVLEAALSTLEVLLELLPGRTEPRGLLAQALLLRSRAETRTDAQGRPVALAAQDRGRWDRELIERADRLVLDGLGRGGRGPYLLQGAIAAAVAVPRRHEEVDWQEVVELYDALLVHWPTAIVRLGRAVAVSESSGAAAALADLSALAEELAGHRPFHVIRGELLHRLGEHEQAAAAHRTALDCRGDEGEAALLRERLAADDAIDLTAGTQPGEPAAFPDAVR